MAEAAGAQGTEQQGTPGTAGTPPPGTNGAPPAGAAGAGGGTQQTPPKAKEDPPARTEPKRHKLEADGEVPDDAEVLELSPRALKSRLARSTATELKKKFGTDDVDKIAADLKELATYREEKEKKRKAELSDLEREREEHEKTKGRATAAEARAREVSELRVFDKEDRRISKVAGKYIDEDYVDEEMNKFAAHLTKTFTDKELKKLRGAGFEEEAEKYFKGRVEKKPKLAKDYEETRSKEIAQELKDIAAGRTPKKKVTNGADVSGRKKPEPTEDTGGPKTFAPGKKNSMSDKEVRDELKKRNGGRMPY